MIPLLGGGRECKSAKRLNSARCPQHSSSKVISILTGNLQTATFMSATKSGFRPRCSQTASARCFQATAGSKTAAHAIAH